MKRNVISALAVAGLLACSLNQNSAYAGNVTITDYSQLPGAGLISGDTLTLDANIIVTDDNMQSYFPSGTFTIFGQGNELNGSSTHTGISLVDPSIYTLNNVNVKNFLRTPGNGGAIDNSGTLNLTGTTVTGDTNRATTGSGGFLYNTYSTNSSATNLVLTSNTAQTGGAIYNNTGATFAATGDISASGNSATTNEGGAIYNAGTANIATATFTSNSSNLGGGAIFNTGNLTATGNVIFGDYTGSVASQGNSTSSGHGGAIYNSGSVNLQGGAEFYDNSASSGTTAHGGAIYNTGTLSIGGANLTAIENVAASGNGGFLYNSSATLVNLTSTNITLSGNSALSGGAIYNNSGTVNITGDLTASGNQATAGDGGFLYAGAGSSTSIDNATISSNTATGRGGAIYMEGTAGNAAVVNIDASTSDTTFTNNTAAGGSSDAIYMNSNSTVNIDSAAGTQVVFNDAIIANMLANEININSGNATFNGDIKVNATSSLEITNSGTTQLSTATMTSGTAGNPNTFTINSNAGSVTSTGAVSANNYNEVNLNTTTTGTISLNTVSVGTSSDVNLNAAVADSINITNLNVTGTGNTVDSTGENANIGTVTFSGTSDLTLNTQNLSITTGVVSNGAGTLNKAAAGTLNVGSLTVSSDNSLTVNSNAGDTVFTTANLADATSGNTTLSLNANAGNIASTGAVAVNDGNILNLANNASGSTLVLDSVTMGENSQINIAANNTTAGAMDLGSLTLNSTGNTITNSVPANSATVGAITFNNTSDLTLASGGLDITSVTSNGVGTLTKSATGTQALGTLAVGADNTLNVTSSAGDTIFTTANLTSATAGNTTTLGLTANASNIASTGAVSLNDNNTLNLTTDATGTISLNGVVLNSSSQVRAFSGNATAGSLDLGSVTVNSIGNTIYNNLTASDAVLGDITFNNTSSLTLGSGNLQIDNIISNGNATLNKNVAGTQDLGSLTINTDNSLTINSLVGTTNFTTANLANATFGNTTLSLRSDAGTIASTGLVSVNDNNILNLTNAVTGGSISLNSVAMGSNSQININANRTTSGAVNLGSLTVNSTVNTITNTVPANSATVGAITFNNTSDLTLNSGGLAVTSVTSNGAGTLIKSAAGTQDLGSLAVNTDNALTIDSNAGDTTFTTANLTNATAGNTTLNLNANAGNIASTGAVAVNDGNILNLANDVSGSTLSLNSVTMGANSQINIDSNNTTAGAMDLGSLTVNSTGNTITNTVPANSATVGAITFNNTSDLTLGSAGLGITSVTSNGAGTLNKGVAGTQALGIVTVNADNSLIINSTAGDTNFTDATLAAATVGNNSVLTLNANGGNISSTGTTTVNNGGILNVNEADATSSITFNTLSMTDNTLLDMSNGKTETLDITTFNVLNPTDVAKVRLDIDLTAQTTDFINVANPMTNAITLDFNAANILNNPGGRHVYYFNVANSNVNINDYNNPRVAVFSATNGYYISYLNMPPNLYPDDEYTYPENTIRVTTEDVNDGLRDAVTLQGLRYFDITSLDQVHYVGNSAVTSGDGLLNMEVTTNGSYPGGTLTVRGNSLNGTISGAATTPGLTSVSLFKVDSSADDVSRTLNIEGGITIADAVGTDGAAVYLKDGATAGTANLNLSNVSFTSNQSSAQGGAIYNEGTVASTGAVIFGSATDDTKGNTAGTNGGALYNSTTATFNASTGFYNNTATAGSGGAVYNTGTLSLGNGTGTDIVANENLATAGDGGFLYNNTGSTTTINADTITLNSNQAQNGGAIFNNAGTLSIAGTLSADDNVATTGNGGFLSNDSTVTLGTSTFTSNSANAGLGGGIYNNGGSITASGLTQFGSYNPVTEVTSDGNTATEGGALYNDGTATFNGGLNLFGNSASTGSGGAVSNTNASALSVAGSDFNAVNNQAQTVGGAISNTGGSTVDITSSDILFSGNTALSTTAGGGAIYNSDTSVVTLNGNTTTFIGSADGSVVNANQGGGIFNTGASAVVNIGNITSTSGFSNLVATNEGGAVYNNLGATNIYGDTIFEGNKSSLNGGAIYNNAATTVGSDNTSAHSFQSNSAASGGALYNTGSLALAGSTQFVSNTSTGIGGAIYNNSNLNIGVDNTNINLFSHNTATDGSVIYNDGGSVDIEGSSQFLSNTSSIGGGAVVNNAGVVNIGSDNTNQQVFITNNAVNGAAVTNVGGTVSLEGDTTFTGNTASAKGGAIYNELGTLTVGSDLDSINIFSSNSAQDGGAVYSLNNDLIFNGHTIFTDNTASGNGGAINTNFSDVNLSPYTVFESNSATNGGALFVNGSNVNIEEGTVFLDNSASQNGAAIYMTGTASQNAVVNINSDNPSAPVSFTNNTSGNGNAIYLDKNSTLNLNTSNSADLILPENIAGTSDNNMINVNATVDAPVVFMGDNSKYAGDFYVHSGDAYFTHGSAFFQGGNYTFATNTTLHLLNEQIDTISANSVTFPSSGTSYLTMDADLQTGLNDRFFSHYPASGNVTLSNINLMNENNADDTYFQVANGANVKPLYEGMQTNGKYYKYGVYSAPYGFRAEKQGLIDTSYQAGQVAQVGALANQYVIYNQLSKRADNLSIQKFYERKAKAQQKSSEGTSGVATIETSNSQPETAVFDKAEVKGESPFRRLLAKKNKKETSKPEDEFLKQNQELSKVDSTKGAVAEEKPVSDVVKVAEKSAEKIAATNQNEVKLHLDDSVLPKEPANPSNGVILIDESTLPTLRSDYNQMVSAQSTYDSNSGGVWVDSFTTIETISPSGLSGFKNFNYGVILGYDMPTKTLDNGLELQSTLFGGYQGSNQDYDNVKNYQNGGFGGYMLNLYKDNAFATVSLLAGGIGVDAQDNQGKNNQNYGMFVFGLSSKAGYNIELPANLILQPNLTLAYSFLSGHEGENSIGETLKVNALNNLLVTPGVKLIGNYKGWEPYLTAGYAFPLFGKSIANVNNIGMPNVELRPYIEYGGGVRKNFGERFAGFFEAVYRNGGRTGITFQGGFTIKF